MKLIHIGIILFVLTLTSCTDYYNKVTIPKLEYQMLTKDSLNPVYPKPFELYYYNIKDYEHGIVLGSDGHEYLVLYTGGHSKNVEHYIDCVKCIERSKFQDSIKNK